MQLKRYAPSPTALLVDTKDKNNHSQRRSLTTERPRARAAFRRCTSPASSPVKPRPRTRPAPSQSNPPLEQTVRSKRNRRPPIAGKELVTSLPPPAERNTTSLHS